MPLSRIEMVEVRSFHLEIPLNDFDHLPTRLGCSLERKRGVLVVATEQPLCSLRFDTDGDRAVLADVEIREDIQGRFTQAVLGTLLSRYEGDFDGVLVWKPARRGNMRLVVRGGETSHPLLEPVVTAAKEPQERPPADDVASRVEAHLTAAREAWQEYQRLKASRDRQTGPKA